MEKTSAISGDLSAVVAQSSVDKLLNATSFPFVVFEHREDFHGKLSGDSVKELGPKEIKELLSAASKYAAGQTGSDPPATEADQIHDAVIAAAGSVIESAKAALNASSDPKYTGPPAAMLQAIVDGGVEGLASTKGIQFKGHLALLRVTATDRPTLKLGAPRIGLDGVKATVTATGELWWYHPELHCRKWCLDWSVTWKWDRIVSLTVSPAFDGAAHADVLVSGTMVKAVAVVDRLRLDYPILREIPLEGLANRYLGNRLVVIYDAGLLLPAVPLIGARFRVSEVQLPPSSGQVEIQITVSRV